MDVGSRVVEVAPLFWQAKLVGAVVVAILFSKNLYRMLRDYRFSATSFPTSTIWSPIISQYYSWRLWRTASGFASITLLALAHAGILSVMLLHTPIIMAIVESIIGLGSKPLGLASLVNYFHENFSLLGVLLASSSLASLAIYKLVLAPRGLGGIKDHALALLVVAALFSGIVSWKYPALETLHAIIGYTTTIALLTTNRGLHWARTIIALVAWTQKPLSYSRAEEAITANKK